MWHAALLLRGIARLHPGARKVESGGVVCRRSSGELFQEVGVKVNLQLPNHELFWETPDIDKELLQEGRLKDWDHFRYLE